MSQFNKQSLQMPKPCDFLINVTKLLAIYTT